MSNSILRKTPLALALVMFVTGSIQVHAGFGLKSLCSKLPGCGSGTNCCANCKLEAEVVDAEKTCFEVEPKVICIPRVVFPWQKKSCSLCSSCDGHGCSSCINNGAKVRTICVLKAKKYTCPECEYTWTPEKGCCGDCGGNCDSGCCSSAGSCCDSGCDTVCDEVLMPVHTSAQALTAPVDGYSVAAPKN